MNNSFIAWQTQSAMAYFNKQPSQVKGVMNDAVKFYQGLLFDEIFSVYDFKLHDMRQLPWFRYFLFQYGSVAFIYHPALDNWILYPYSVKAFNYMYQPANIEVIPNGDGFKPVSGTVGVDCEIIYIKDNYFGLYELVTTYAELLAQCDKDINVNLMNANVSLAAYAKDKKEADELKEAYAKATTGQPFIVMNDALFFDGSMKPFFNDIKSSFIADDLQKVKRTIFNDFLTKVGIRNTNYDKRERLTTDEVNENNDETKSLVKVYFDNLAMCFERCRKVSGLEMSVKLAYNYDRPNEPEEKRSLFNIRGNK